MLLSGIAMFPWPLFRSGHKSLGVAEGTGVGVGVALGAGVGVGLAKLPAGSIGSFVLIPMRFNIVGTENFTNTCFTLVSTSLFRGMSSVRIDFDAIKS